MSAKPLSNVIMYLYQNKGNISPSKKKAIWGDYRGRICVYGEDLQGNL
jgi:hypothetical protein